MRTRAAKHVEKQFMEESVRGGAVHRIMRHCSYDKLKIHLQALLQIACPSGKNF